MKLAALAVVALLGGVGVAHADSPAPRRPALRQFLLTHFDKNHDGRLEPRERKMAARALRRLANRMARGDNARQMRHQRFIQRFDLNGDGNIGPGEMPPGLADELRPLDRDGNGWLQGDELP